MHEWHQNRSKNIMRLINEFMGYEFDTDHSGRLEVKQVNVLDRVFNNDEDAINFVTSKSYYTQTAFLVPYTTKKLSKGYQNAFKNFISRYNEYQNFDNNLTIAYGRTSSKATCPSCGSAISLKYGRRFKRCPVCGSEKIISDSNWKTLETKRRMAEKASEALEKEAIKNDVTFICGIEWHC